MSKSQDLKPIDSPSMADRVENQLREYFYTNAFKPGDSLPGEMEIAEKLSVSRNVVREALSRLRMLGIIETKPRRGMVMARPDVLGGFERVLNPFILGKDTLQDIFEIRLILELGMSEFLFKRKNEHKIEELEEIVRAHKNIRKPTKEEELQFHNKLYEIAGNKTLKRFQVLLSPIFEHVFSKQFTASNETQPANHVHHDNLVDILKNGTPAEFREAMKVHLNPYLTYIE